MKIMLPILQKSESDFVCDGVRYLLKEMISLRVEFNKLARKNAVPRTKPTKKFSEPVAEIYPNNPTPTMDNR